MEYVPFRFRQFVTSLLSFKGYRNKVKRLSSTAWQNSIDAQLANRINVACCIGYEDGVWSYSILQMHDDQEFTFEELRNLNRQKLRISSIEVTCEIFDHDASPEEITELVKFAPPFVNMAKLSVHKTEEFPRGDLPKMLSYLRNSSIRSLYYESWDAQTWDALSVHLKSASLKSLEIRRREASAEQKSAVKEFLLHNLFMCFASDSPDFLDMDMFKHLFYKPKTEPSWKIQCRASFELEDLRDFEKDLQVWSPKNRIGWKRQDGLQIEAGPHPRMCLPRLSIRFF